jgi:hypothetical protein
MSDDTRGLWYRLQAAGYRQQATGGGRLSREMARVGSLPVSSSHAIKPVARNDRLLHNRRIMMSRRLGLSLSALVSTVLVAADIPPVIAQGGGARIVIQSRELRP